jgi:hypothetical protein
MLLYVYIQIHTYCICVYLNIYPTLQCNFWLKAQSNIDESVENTDII